MKLSKVLLSAIAVGVAVQATSSCGSKKKDPAPKEEQTAKTGKEPMNCPGCGLG
jgi:hypothetical protein